MDDISCLEVEDWPDEPPQRLPGIPSSSIFTTVQPPLKAPLQQSNTFEPARSKRQEPDEARQPLEHSKRASVQPARLKAGSHQHPLSAARPSPCGGQQNALPSIAPLQSSQPHPVRRHIDTRPANISQGFVEPQGSQGQQSGHLPFRVSSTSEQHSASQQPATRQPLRQPATSQGPRSTANQVPCAGALASAPQAQRRIPGPAGVLLDAQQRGLQVTQLADICDPGGAGPSRTLRPGALVDPDFFSPAWTGALHALGIPQFDDTSPFLEHTVRTVLEVQTSTKIPKLLAMVASTRPDGSGNAYAMCKDPTGTVGAGIHKAVLAAEPALGPGCVLLLQKVTALKLPSSACSLCITLENVVQVHPASDFPSQPIQICGAPAQEHAAQQDRPRWQDGIPGSPQLSEAFPQSSSRATATALGMSKSSTQGWGAARPSGEVVGSQQGGNQRQAVGIAVANRQAASLDVAPSILDASQSQPDPISPSLQSQQQEGAGRKRAAGALKGRADNPVRMANAGLQPNQRQPPLQQQHETQKEREATLRSVFDFDMGVELQAPAALGRTAVGGQRRGAATADTEDMAELMEGLDDNDLAGTGLWTP